MQAVAAAVGVRAPSLYKHVPGRSDLIRLITDSVLDDLGFALASAVGGDPARDLAAQARAFRRFAHDHPGAYRLVFAPLPDESRPDRERLVAASRPVLDTVQALVGDSDALDAARLVTAWAHGFLTMELSGAFRLDGDVDRAFEWGLARLIASLT